MLPRVLLIDNHDSFTWNLAQLLEESGLCRFSVMYNDELSIRSIGAFDKVIFSPGPGIPSEVPIMKEIIISYCGSHGILGICLGHQAIVEALGGSLLNLEHVVHGIRQKINVVEPVDSLFRGIPLNFTAGLYHSWAADPDYLPSNLRVTASGPDGVIMAVSHTTLNLKGVQFHPESYMTEVGRLMLQNWLKD
jgi:anthranilate synthase component 2